MFPGSESKLSLGSNRTFLPPLKAAPDAIQLEIFFLERPAEDPLLATAIWKDIDKLGDLPSETRETLERNGFRVARINSNPPTSVQKLLGMVAAIPSESPEYTKPLMGRHQFLCPGIESEIPTGIDRAKCEVVVKDKDGTRDLVFERASSLFRMKAFRLQDGWVRVDLQPEIHHGERQMRTTVTDQGLGIMASRNIEPFLAQRFSVTMNVGETVMVTSTKDDEGSLGDQFFCHEIGGSSNQPGPKKQRMLFIRIVDAGQSQNGSEN